jgi:hypothetical protein
MHGVGRGRVRVYVVVCVCVCLCVYALVLFLHALAGHSMDIFFSRHFKSSTCDGGIIFDTTYCRRYTASTLYSNI